MEKKTTSVLDPSIGILNNFHSDENRINGFSGEYFEINFSRSLFRDEEFVEEN